MDNLPRPTVYMFCLFMLIVLAPLAYCSMPSPNSRIITEQGMFFYNGELQACRITFDLAVVGNQTLSPINAQYYPSLSDFGIDNNGLCGGSSATVPAGQYLLADGKVYYSNGSGQSCRYVNVPPWINVANLAMYPSFPSDLSSDGGICDGWDGPNQYPSTQLPVENSAFVTDGGIFFNNGLGHACKITYNMAVRDHWNLSHIGVSYFPSLQQANLIDDGNCNPGEQEMAVGQFLTADGTVYYSNGLGHACRYGFAGGIATDQLTMYPNFPTDLVVYDGACGASPFIDVAGLGMDRSGSNDSARTNSNLLRSALASSPSPSLYFRNGIYTVESPSMDDHDNPFTLTIGSNVTFAGEGTISGRDDVDHAFIVVEGSLSTTIPISESQLDAGASTVHLDNDDHHGGTILRAGDLVFLNNYPTDPGGADLCTPPSQPNATQCSYPNEGPNSLHSFRRREVLRVLSSDSTSVTFANGIQNSYPNVLSNAASTYALWRGIQSYVFITPIQPVANVTIRDIELRRLYLGTKYISNLSIESARAYQTTLALGTCIECKVNFREFDAGGEDNEVNFYEGSQSVKVSGYYHGATCPSDCGIIKFVQGNSAEIIGTFGGLVASATNHGIQHAVMIDTDYLEDLTGFSNGPTSNIHIEATYQPSNDNGQPDVFLSGEPWLAANLTDASIKVSDVALRLSGSNSITVQGLGTGGLSISRSQNVAITGGTYTDVKLDGDGPDGIIPSNNVSLSGLTLKHIPTNNPSDPTWVEVYDTNLLSLTDVTVDITGAPVQATQTFFPLIQFKDVDGLIIQNLRVRCIANQTGLLFWDAGNISNFNAIGGSYTLPVPFPGVVPNGQTGSTSCPTP